MRSGPPADPEQSVPGAGHNKNHLSSSVSSFLSKLKQLFCSLPSLAERTKTEMFFKTYSAELEDMFGVPLRGIRATKKFR